MISFVWSSKYPFVAGSGGSESYTAGQIRELRRQGIVARIITVGFGEDDGRKDYPDIPFLAVDSKEELAELDDTLIFVTYPLAVKTKRQSYVILHCPPKLGGQYDPLFDRKGLVGKQPIAPSKFAAKLWKKELKQRMTPIPTAYPFAEASFGSVQRPSYKDAKTRVLFAGRLIPDKGIYTLLAALHMPNMRELDYELTVTAAGSHTEDGQIISRMLQAHPNLSLVPARPTPPEMAQLMARADIVVIPSTGIFWKEIFGMVSVEAQHAGCRVVASNDGGLPETNCGGLTLVKPDDPQALARGIVRAAQLGPLTQAERAWAATQFTVQQSVKSLLGIIVSTENHVPRPLYQQGTLMLEQLDFAFNNMRHLGRHVVSGGETKLSGYKARPASS